MDRLGPLQMFKTEYAVAMDEGIILISFTSILKCLYLELTKVKPLIFNAAIWNQWVEYICTFQME